MKKLLSINEILALEIPHLPSTRVGMRAFAEREGWAFETATGVGGTKKLYELPAKYAPYLDGLEKTDRQPVKGVVGMTLGANRIDPARLELAIRALSEWESERGVKVSDERRAAVLSILYDYAQDAAGESGTNGMEVVLRALGGS